MYFRLSTKIIVIRVLLALITSGIIGLLIGQTFMMLAFTALALLFWHYNHLFKLIDWLWLGKSISPPQANGIWGRIYDGLYRRSRKQRLKQKQLNERLRKFRDGAEALPDAALVLSNDLAILWGNKKSTQLMGIRWPGDIGQRIDNLIRFPEFSKYLDDAEFDSPCLIISPLNSDIQLELRLMAYGSDQILLLARDISKVQRLENMRRDFVANVSHELKTPLTVVRGYVEMVQISESDLAPHWQKAFDTIESQVSRMDRLVEQLLVLSRVENNSEDDNSQQVDLSRLVLNIVEDVQWLNQEKSHQLRDNIAPNIAIIGNEHELKSACVNLISNAIAYTKAGGEITISLAKNGNKVRFSVKDNGPGIKPEDVNRLTERFFRVDKSRSRNTGGSGLGLAIVKHILNHHSAQLSIESEWGKGSEFIIYFNI
jgi:two-component system phosphate regulon sensor histidine kinase PhoR